MTVAQYLTSLFKSAGVDAIPVLQGGAIMKLIDEVGENTQLTYISPNHEQALAMMVDAYARIKGFGIGMVTSGPGAQNLATGIACAYYDSIPCMFITGQVGMFHNKGERRVRQRGFQETDIVSMVKPITKYAVLLEKAEDVRYVFEKALYLAKSGRPGPVLIDVPFNVQRALINPEELKGYTPESPVVSSLQESEKSIEDIFIDIENSKKPLILLGGGVHLANQSETVRALIAKLNVPVVATWCALDIFEAENPFYGGNIGRAGNKSANRAIREADLLLTLGTRFATKAIISEKNFAKKAKIISVDIDRGELEDGLVPAQVKLQFDLGEFLPRMLRAAQTKALTPKVEWLDEFAQLKRDGFRNDNTPKGTSYVNPYKFTETLSELLTSNSIIVGDTGTNLCWFAQAYAAKYGQRMISSWGNSPMGYALPAAIGAYLANKDANIIVINGDGGMQMNIQELQTIALNKIPVKVFVLNNDCYANVKFPAIDEFHGRFHALGRGMGYAAPDFVKIAGAYGIPAFSIRGSDDLEGKIKEALSTDGPVVVDVIIDPEQRAWEDLELLAPPPIPK